MSAKAVQATEGDRYIPRVEVHAEEDVGPFDEDGLSVRQRQFVAAIVGPASGNASKAAEMAGYASDNRNALRVTASRLLTKANIQEAIAHELAKRRATPEWAKNQLIDLAQGSLANFITIDEQGKEHLDWAKALSRGAMGQLKEYDFSTGKIKIHDRTAALGMLLKLHGLLKESNEPEQPERMIRVRKVQPKPQSPPDDGNAGNQ